MESGSGSWRMLYGHGPANGTLLVLPLDQGLEHGPADFFDNPAALDTDFQFRLALEGKYSAIALGIGLAEKYMKDYCGRVPLILKLNGKTNIATTPRPSRPCPRASRTPSGWAPTPSATRSTSARRARTRASASSRRCGRTASGWACRS